MPAPRRRLRFVPRAPNIAPVGLLPAAVILVVVPLAVLLPAMGHPLPPWVPLAGAGLIVLLVFLLIARVMLFTRRIARSDGFLCLNCYYDLHGLADSGTCPECGEPYERARLERCWNYWLLSQTKQRRTIRPSSPPSNPKPPS